MYDPSNDVVDNEDVSSAVSSKCDINSENEQPSVSDDAPSELLSPKSSSSLKFTEEFSESKDSGAKSRFELRPGHQLYVLYAAVIHSGRFK